VVFPVPGNWEHTDKPPFWAASTMLSNRYTQGMSQETVTEAEVVAICSRASARKAAEGLASSGRELHHVEAAWTVISGRPPEWQQQFFDSVYNQWLFYSTDIAPVLARRLVLHGYLVPESVHYLSRHGVPHAKAEREAATPGSDVDLDWQFFLAHGLRLFFSVEGAANGISDQEKERRTNVMTEISDESPEFRARILDETLGALLRDFSAYGVSFYLHLHRHLEPKRVEVLARQSTYVQVLYTEPTAAVALAQELLRPILAELDDVEALLSASAAVFLRRDKKSVLAQLSLLAELAKARPEFRDRIAETLDTLAISDKPDLLARALKLRGSLVESPAAAASVAEPHGEPHGATVRVPGPRRVPLAVPEAGITPVRDADELAELFGALLEHPYPGEDIVRAVDGVVRLVGVLPEAVDALVTRSWTVLLKSPYDRHGVDPRRRIAALALAWTTADRSMLGAQVSGNHLDDRSRAVVFGVLDKPAEGHRDPQFVNTIVGRDFFDVERAWRLFIEHRDSDLSSSSVVGAAAAWLDQAARWAREPDTAAPLFAGLSSAAKPDWEPRWERVVMPFGGRISRYFDVSETPKVGWIDSAAPAATAGIRDGSPAELYDLETVSIEADNLYEIAREVRHAAAAFDWARVIYGDNLDYLAAQAHPALSAARDFINVPTGTIVDALGAAREPLGAPGYSALALAASDKSAEGRARAAEAVASLAASGLLDPVLLAEQLVTLLGEGQVVATRIAVALTDTSSISAIAGWRVLEVLRILLPDILDVTGAASLLALAAKLADAYGVAIEVPPALAAKSKGNGPKPVAVRALLATRATHTALAEQAAREGSA